jgi:aarF domain-containing kinase
MVALELSRIFSQMVFLNGFFHADPHPGLDFTPMKRNRVEDSDQEIS